MRATIQNSFARTPWEILIVEPAPEHEEQLVAVHQAAFVAGYSNPPEITKALLTKFVHDTSEKGFATRKAAYWQTITDRLLEPDLARCTVVAKHLGKVGAVGFGEGVIDRDGRSWISGLYVHPNFWGRGVGSALLDTILEYHQGAEVHLHVTEWAAAVNFYEQHGFVRTEKLTVPVPKPKLTPQGPILTQIEMVYPAQHYGKGRAYG